MTTNDRYQVGDKVWFACARDGKKPTGKVTRITDDGEFIFVDYDGGDGKQWYRNDTSCPSVRPVSPLKQLADAAE